MDHKRFDIGYIGKKREYLKIVYELERCILAALDLKCKDACSAIREVALIQRMVRMIRQRRMIDLIDLWVISKIFHYFGSILRMPFEPQRQCLCSLKQQESCEWRYACALVAQ